MPKDKERCQDKSVKLVVTVENLFLGLFLAS